MFLLNILSKNLRNEQFSCLFSSIKIISDWFSWFQQKQKMLSFLSTFTRFMQKYENYRSHCINSLLFQKSMMLGMKNRFTSLLLLLSLQLNSQYRLDKTLFYTVSLQMFLTLYSLLSCCSCTRRSICTFLSQLLDFCLMNSLITLLFILMTFQNYTMQLFFSSWLQPYWLMYCCC